VQLFAAIHLHDIFVITLRGCPQVARLLLEISQRTYPVASRMIKLSAHSSTIQGGGKRRADGMEGR
jgi:hypothetical protein